MNVLEWFKFAAAAPHSIFALPCWWYHRHHKTRKNNKFNYIPSTWATRLAIESNRIEWNHGFWTTLLIIARWLVSIEYVRMIWATETLITTTRKWIAVTNLMRPKKERNEPTRHTRNEIITHLFLFLLFRLMVAFNRLSWPFDDYYLLFLMHKRAHATMATRTAAVAVITTTI